MLVIRIYTSSGCEIVPRKTLYAQTFLPDYARPVEAAFLVSSSSRILSYILIFHPLTHLIYPPLSTYQSFSLSFPTAKKRERGRGGRGGLSSLAIYIRCRVFFICLTFRYRIAREDRNNTHFPFFPRLLFLYFLPKRRNIRNVSWEIVYSIIGIIVSAKKKSRLVRLFSNVRSVFVFFSIPSRG